MAEKRANDEGSLRKRSNGHWEGHYTAGHDPETGKAIYKNVLAKTQKECKEKLAVALEQARKVDAHKTDQHTVGQWAETWYETTNAPYCAKRFICATAFLQAAVRTPPQCFGIVLLANSIQKSEGGIIMSRKREAVFMGINILVGLALSGSAATTTATFSTLKPKKRLVRSGIPHEPQIFVTKTQATSA